MRLKKLLAFVVSLAMVMSIVPAMGIVAFADDSQAAEAVVAKVGEEEFYSLAQAIAVAEEEYTQESVKVTLLGDSSESFTLNGGIVELIIGENEYTGEIIVASGMLISDREIKNVVCKTKGTNPDKTKYGYTSHILGAEMFDGAQVRLGEGADEDGKVTGEGSGLRFITTVNMIDTLAGIAYEHYDSKNGTYDDGYQIGAKIEAEDGEKPAVVPATLWQTEGEVFTTALTNLAETNYNRKFTASPYVEVEGIRFEDDSYVERSIYQIAAGLLTGSETAETTEMSEALVNVLNAYVNQTGVRLTLSDSSAEATLTARTNGNGAYSGEVFFTVGDTVYNNGKYQVVLKAVGQAVINTALFNEYVRINNNNTNVTSVTGITDNNNGTYTVTFDYADAEKINGSGVINVPFTLQSGEMSAYLPEGVAFTGSADKLNLSVTSIDDETSEIKPEEGEDLKSFNIRVNGVAANNTTPIILTLTNATDEELNPGNLKLYHVENGVKAEMERVESVSNLTKHNQFAYNSSDGTVYVALASFGTTIGIAIKTETKFSVLFPNTDKYLYRVGNSNTVALGSLFEAAPGVKIGNVSIAVEAQNGASASGTYTANTSDWTKGTIKFSNTGVVKVTITDDDGCIPTELYLEVVDAKNITSAENATKNDVVLLNDCGFSSLEVSNGYTLYGNGFTMTCSSDYAAADLGYAFVTLNNGTLDNVQIDCPDFDYAALYKTNLTSNANRTDATGNHYYNARSGVMASGNSQILNSRISGGRASLNVSGGNVVVDNSRIELGAVATILVSGANSLVLRDVTLIQKPTASTYDRNKTLMGFSVLYLCDSEGNATPTTIEGSFVQQAWVDESDKQYVPGEGQSIVDAVLKENDYLHDIDGNGTSESLNLGFAYMSEDLTKTVAEPTNITDDRTDKIAVPYEMKDIKITVLFVSATVYVYSYKNTNGTDDAFITETEYVPNKYSDIITVTYSDTAEGLQQSKSYGTDGWVYELNVDLDKANGYEIDFGKLSMTVNGVVVDDYKVNGNSKPDSPVAVTAGGTTYELTATIGDKEYSSSFKVTGTETSKESPSLVASNYEAGVCVASKYGGTWHGAAPALEGIQIKYWSVAEKQYKTIDLADYTPTTPGKQNGTNTTWTYSHDNGDFTLTLTGGQVHSSNNVYAMPVVCDGKLYFVAANSNGLVNSGNSARTISVSYVFEDNNNGTPLKFSHTWSVAENKDEQYSYSDFCNGTLTLLESGSSGGGCVTPETLITLADGSQVEVQNLKGDEELLVWNLETGKYDTAPIVFVDVDDAKEYEIIHLYFEDETDVEVIYEHGFFDVICGEYVYLDRNTAKEHIGHSFVMQDDMALNTWKTVELTDVVLEKKITKAYSPVTYKHLCYYTDGMLSMPGGIEGLFNIFEVDTEIMAYDSEKVEQDIETYGLYTYEDFEDIIPEVAYEAYNGDILKVAIGKGMLTWERIYELAERYVK